MSGALTTAAYFASPTFSVEDDTPYSAFDVAKQACFMLVQHEAAFQQQGEAIQSLQQGVGELKYASMWLQNATETEIGRIYDKIGESDNKSQEALQDLFHKCSTDVLGLQNKTDSLARSSSDAHKKLYDLILAAQAEYKKLNTKQSAEQTAAVAKARDALNETISESNKRAENATELAVRFFTTKTDEINGVLQSFRDWSDQVDLNQSALKRDQKALEVRVADLREAFDLQTAIVNSLKSQSQSKASSKATQQLIDSANETLQKLDKDIKSVSSAVTKLNSTMISRGSVERHRQEDGDNIGRRFKKLEDDIRSALNVGEDHEVRLEDIDKHIDRVDARAIKSVKDLRAELVNLIGEEGLDHTEMIRQLISSEITKALKEFRENIKNIIDSELQPALTVSPSSARQFSPMPQQPATGKPDLASQSEPYRAAIRTSSQSTEMIANCRSANWMDTASNSQLLFATSEYLELMPKLEIYSFPFALKSDFIAHLSGVLNAYKNCETDLLAAIYREIKDQKVTPPFSFHDALKTASRQDLAEILYSLRQKTKRSEVHALLRRARILDTYVDGPEFKEQAQGKKMMRVEDVESKFSSILNF